MRPALLLLVLLACAAKNEPASVSKNTPAPAAEDAAPLPRGSVRFETPKPWSVQVEVAATDEARMRGLMNRRDLAPDTGMIFVFPESRVQSFWMHDTYLSLDMIFVGEDRTVVGVVSNARPLDDTPLGVGKPSRYVIEVKAGEASAHGVAAGTKVALALQ